MQRCLEMPTSPLKDRDCDSMVSSAFLNFDHPLVMMASRIVELAKVIANNTESIDEHIRLHNHLQPSFDVHGPVEAVKDAPPEVRNARDSAIEACIELQQLLQGVDRLLLPEV